MAYLLVTSGTSGVDNRRPGERLLITSLTLMDEINALEREFPVTEWRVSDLRVWPMLRVRWFFSRWAATYGAAHSVPGPGRVATQLRRVGALVAGRMAKHRAASRDGRGEDAGHGERDIVFLSDGVSFVSVDGMQYERFCDPLLLRASERGLSSLLMCPTHAYRIPRLTPSRFVQESIDIANLRGLLGARGLASRLELPRHHEVRQWLGERGHDDGALDRGSVARDCARLLAVASMFGRTLDRVRPKIAFIVSYYYLEGYAFILACRRRGIPVVDLQHGVQGALHPAYGRMPRPPMGGFGVLPDVFWVWSGEEAEAIETWAGDCGPHGAYVGGNPWLEMWRTGSAPSFASAREQARVLRARTGSLPVVLVTLQGGLSESEQLGPLRALIELSAGEWSWWIRLHPAMVESPAGIRQFLMIPGAVIAVEEPSAMPLYALLPVVDVHMTHSSSTVIEAAACGLRSVITSRYGAELFASQIASGSATMANGDAGACLMAMRRQVKPASAFSKAEGQFPRSCDTLLGRFGL